MKIAFPLILGLTALFLGLSTSFLLTGCSIAYKPDVRDSTINHQSDNTIRPATDVKLEVK